MTVSIGLYNKIKNWLIDEYSGEICYRPFQVDGNPYKSKIFIINSYPEPLAINGANDTQAYANSLVDQKLFNQMNEDELQNSSREYKGTLNFTNWMKETYKRDVVLTSVNCYVAKEETVYKQLKKLNSPLIVKGARIFKEVIEEFAPSVIILQGSKTIKEFQEQFKERLKIKKDFTLPIQELEGSGVIAKLRLKNGDDCLILACRSMSHFGKNGQKFIEFKDQLAKTIKNLK